MTKKPLCVHCQKPYGQRSTEAVKVTWKDGSKPPAYTGNKIVTKFVDVGSNGNQRYGYRYLWDGHSYYTQYKPFCTLRCALAYARKAYQEHLSNVEEC